MVKFSKKIKKKKTKTKDKKADLKEIVVENPSDAEEEGIIHPEVEQDIKEHIEEDDDTDDEDSEEEKDDEDSEEDVLQGEDFAEDLIENYERPEKGYDSGGKDGISYYNLESVKENPGIEYPANQSPLKAEEATLYSSEREEDIRIDDVYEPGEGFDGDYEKLMVKTLESGKMVPGGFMKYLNPVRRKMLEIFSLGWYKRNKRKD
ncbi:hypothetical protein GF361_00835 [Candidatus Woesearchaeota archaeon]|nr:hypothetical protein [Candidatus Woesearchaeota archaeon]